MLPGFPASPCRSALALSYSLLTPFLPFRLWGWNISCLTSADKHMISHFPADSHLQEIGDLFMVQDGAQRLVSVRVRDMLHDGMIELFDRHERVRMMVKSICGPSI
jgi:hypothetical protein